MCIAVGIVGAAVVGGVVQGVSAKSAADTQAHAAQRAQDISHQEFNTITGQEQPFMNAGYGAQSQLNYLLGNGTPGHPGTAGSSTAGGFGSLLQPFNASYMQQYSPAYKFQLQQGQQGVLNQDAASQGAESGAALKDLIGFNQQYANTAFNNAFNQYQTQQTNTYNRLAGIAQLGQNAAANTGMQGTALAGQQAQSATNVGTALGAGQIGVGNAIGGSLNNAALLSALYGGQAGGFGGASAFSSGGMTDLGSMGAAEG